MFEVMTRWMTAFLVAATLAVMAPVSPCHAASREERVAAVMQRLTADPPALRTFLAAMPKGGDLHHHLDGSVWAEDYLKWADHDGDCLDAVTHAISPPPCAKSQVEARGLVARDPRFYQSSIDALSMRNFFPGTGTGEVNGHDHTFAAFPRFGRVAAAHLADALVVARRQAAADQVLYLETISGPGAAFSPVVVGGIEHFDAENFDADLRQIEARIPELVAGARAQYDAAEAAETAALECAGVHPEPACAVKTRYLYYVVRLLPPAQVFAQMALGYALCAADPRFVGVNLVAPEDDPVALRDFWLQMRMFRYFSAKYPDVKLSLHSGELTLGLVPPTELGFHIRGAVEVAGASRIGHGYELPYENDMGTLLAGMAQKRIAVEINLTSNDITPGVKGGDHPLHLYLKAGVPVVLSADDEGVFRIDLTHEYVRAAMEQGLRYADLKMLSRNGLEYGFLPAAEKAAMRRDLEAAFDRFEARVLANEFPG